ncbi:MAG TPA: acyl-CoA dehydrogenase family protein, partial [Anaerolineae bacterium]
MDFSFSKEHQMFRQMVHEFAEQEVRPLAMKHDRQESLDPELVRKLGDAGLLGVPFDQKYGGAGLGEVGYCILMEEIG